MLAESRPVDFGSRCTIAGIPMCAPTPQMVRHSAQGTRDEVAGLDAATAQVAAISPAPTLPVLVISRALASSPSAFETLWTQAQQDLSKKYKTASRLIAPSTRHDVHRADSDWFCAAVMKFALTKP